MSTKKPRHKASCNEYHQHRAPHCCAPDCPACHPPEPEGDDMDAQKTPQDADPTWVRIMKRLVIAARTSGGTLGPDAGLMQACCDAEDHIVSQGYGDGRHRPKSGPEVDGDTPLQRVIRLEEQVAEIRSKGLEVSKGVVEGVYAEAHEHVVHALVDALYRWSNEFYSGTHEAEETHDQ